MNRGREVGNEGREGEGGGSQVCRHGYHETRSQQITIHSTHSCGHPIPPTHT